MSTRPDKLTCRNGHTFPLPAGPETAGEVACPDCGETVPVDASVSHKSGSKGRSLWAVMQRSGKDVDAAQGESVAVSESSVEATDSAAATEASPAETTSVEPAEPKPKSLWSVVASARKSTGQSDRMASEDKTREGESSSGGPSAGATGSPDSVKASEKAERPRGLWAMMGQRQEPESATVGPPGESDDESSSGSSESFVEAREETGSSRGGWAVVNEDDEGASLEELLNGDGDFEIRKPGGATSTSAFSEAAPVDETVECDSADVDEENLLDDEHDEDGWEVEEFDEDDEESVAAPVVAAPSIEVPLPIGPTLKPGLKTAMLSAVCGAAAFLFAGLNLLPEFWAKVPSTVFGLGALVWGYQSLNESKRSADRARLRLMAGGGLALGLLGMFAGPLFLTSIGNNWREEQLRTAITRNLEQIGEGVEVFYEHHGAFPRATYKVDGEFDIPMHSWMSALLPHMGYEQVALSIDRTKSYDDPANFTAMSTVIPTFLVPNVAHQPTLRGLATTHFAGVGGETLTDAGQVDVGVFSRGVTLNLDSLSDGASQTMMAGEITKALPAWGEPGNWRTIGRGLNRQVSGFGNTAGTGAHFLMADGSVRFFPNSTSHDVLVRLSTRNGGDPVTVP